MNDLTKIILLTIMLSLTRCGIAERKTINLNSGKNQLTILKFENGKYLVPGLYDSKKRPQTDYIKTDIILEYHIGLAKWTENGIEIYSDYGNFDTIAANGKIKLIDISTKEFEELKKDSAQYTYFYY